MNKSISSRSNFVTDNAVPSPDPVLLNSRYSIDLIERPSGIVLRSTLHSVGRKVLYVNSYGMSKAVRLYCEGRFPINHCWGVIELAARGYEVLIPDPTRRKGLSKRLTNDATAARWMLSDMGPDDIVYCAHNVLLWTTFLNAFRLKRCRIVGLLFAKEPLLFANQYDGIIAHTPAAFDHARKISSRGKVRHISWGMDLDFFRTPAYAAGPSLSCGKTYRDFETLARASIDASHRLVVVHPQPNALPAFSVGSVVVNASKYGENVYLHLAQDYLPNCGAVVVTTRRDERKRHSVGLTNVLEAMASARPVIVSRTNAIVDEVDVEALGAGVFVNPEDPADLSRAFELITADSQGAEAMGLAGRKACRDHFNSNRFSEDLHQFFETLG